MSYKSTDPQDESAPRWRVVCIALIVFALAAGFAVDAWRSGRPAPLPDVAHEKFECASYTPSHNGRLQGAAERRELVRLDLSVLAKRFNCVRTYSVSEGLDTVPEVARELGLKVMLGMWISMDAPSNDREIAHGLELANRFSDVVTAVVVGNEVLLRRELTPAQLRTLIERVRAGTSVPVTYADVWEFWLRNADLANVTNFVTIHILPYWEDNPIDIDRALDHVQSIYKKVQAAFPAKRIFIGETGWPSVGRPRLDAVPSLINEARFVREFVVYAERNKIPYNLIEAFDQPWKRNQEGTVGGYWGLFDADAKPKFAFTGPVVANPFWRISMWVALLGAVAFGMLGALLRPRPSFRSLALLVVVGHLSGSVLVQQWMYATAANRSTLEWFATSVWALVGWCAVAMIAVALARWADGKQLSRPLGVASVLRNFGYGAVAQDRIARVLGVTRALILSATAYVGLALSYDGRGRDFPIAFVLMPAVGFALLAFANSARQRDEIDREELLLALILLATSIFVLFYETLINVRAVLWALLCCLLAATIAVGFRRPLHPHQRAQQETGAAQFKRI